MLLFYARAIDSTMLTALSMIVSQQVHPTEQTPTCIKYFLDYSTTNNEAVITYHASDMVLVVHIDASYLTEPKANRVAGGYFFLSANMTFPPNNGVIHNTEQIINNVMLSTAEAELGMLYIMIKLTTKIRYTLMAMKQLQPPTLVQTYHSSMHGVMSNKTIPKVTKSMDVHFHLLCDWAQQKQFQFYLLPERANYTWMKHHPVVHHCLMHKFFLTNLATLCGNIGVAK